MLYSYVELFNTKCLLLPGSYILVISLPKLRGIVF